VSNVTIAPTYHITATARTTTAWRHARGLGTSGFTASGTIYGGNITA